MSSWTKRWRSSLAVVVPVLALVVALVQAPPTLAKTDSLTVVPPSGSSALTGTTYEGLSAAWWQTMLPITTNNNLNPVTDPTGQNCGLGETARIFFLAGSSGTAPVTRSCTVPDTKPIFFPIKNTDCDNLEVGTVFFGATPVKRAVCATKIINGVVKSSLEVTLDGVAVPALARFRAGSPDFSFTVPGPDSDNLLGVPGPDSGFAASNGFWILLSPPSPGTHVIHFQATLARGPAAPFSQDVTYNLTVVRP
jgi:hypothetical protein